MFSNILIVLTLAVPVARCDDPVVVTSNGRIRGARASDGNYTMFLGIPYATVDPSNPFGLGCQVHGGAYGLGHTTVHLHPSVASFTGISGEFPDLSSRQCLRARHRTTKWESLPAPIFNHTFDAYDDSAMCPQREQFNNTIVGTLDCLHLHVYVPSTASSINRLPVMVYIYGGRFKFGWAGGYIYGPQYLVRHDVILVVLNYRLGPYGFMCLDTPSVPGNAGLKDQRAALRWVNNNIEAFDGDSSNITIFGISAGAMSVDMHVISPGSQGLFHRAIIESGSVFIPICLSASNPKVSIDLARQLQFVTDDVDEAFRFIRSVSTADLLRAGEDIGWVGKICVEKSFEGVEPFLSSTPLNILKTGQYKAVPLLIGSTCDEWLYTFSSNFKAKYRSNFDNIQNIFTRLLSSSFKFPKTELLEAAAQIAKEYYIGIKEINMEVFYDIVNFESDFLVNYPTERSLNYHFEKSPHPIYRCVFAYSGEVNFVKRKGNFTDGCAVHGDDVGFLFKQAYMPKSNKPEDQLIIDRVTAMWTNFAKHGDPTPETSELLPVRWPPMSRDSRDYLWIDSELRLDKSHINQRMAFWDLFHQSFSQYYLFA